jgi:hypothetical protein
MSKSPVYTARQLEAWRSFEEVRLSGEYNMWSPHVQDAAGITKAEHLLIISQYEALKAAAQADQEA